MLTLLQMLLSGGVDSTVCAALLRKSLKSDQIRAIHIDNGFMRKGESDQVMESLQKLGLEVKGRKPINLCSSLHVSLFLFLRDDPQQNDVKLLTPVSDLVFNAL